MDEMRSVASKIQEGVTKATIRPAGSRPLSVPAIRARVRFPSVQSNIPEILHFVNIACAYQSELCTAQSQVLQVLQVQLQVKSSHGRHSSAGLQ